LNPPPLKAQRRRRKVAVPEKFAKKTVKSDFFLQPSSRGCRLYGGYSGVPARFTLSTPMYALGLFHK
jgi:hypothetical protein